VAQTKPDQPKTTGNGAADPSRAAVLEAVSTALDRIEYGSVLVKIHQGKVVGIETSTKVRLQD
jgi:hypothetical protein